MAYIVHRRPMVNNIDKVWDSLLGEKSVFPPVDIVEGEKSYRIEADLPGFSDTEVEAVIEDRVLVLQANLPKDTEEETGTYLVRERNRRSFRRSFVIPKDADISSVEASFSNGVLSVVIPKLPEVQPRTIEIKRG